MFSLSRSRWWVYMLLGALLVLVALPIATRASFARAPVACDAASSTLMITIFVNDDPRDMLEIEAFSPPLSSVEVNASDIVGILAELKPRPDGCEARFSIDWELSFVGFQPRKLQTTSRAPIGERLDITLGAQPAIDRSEGLVVIIVRDRDGAAVRTETIALKGKQQ